MPSKSGAQHRFMGHCKSSPNDPKCPPQKVVNEYLKADKGKHFPQPGHMKHLKDHGLS